MNPMSLSGHNVMVTGAGQGIGEAIARLIVALGGRAILVDLQADKVVALANELGADRAEAHIASVSDHEAIGKVVDLAVERNGAIHGLVNNAGIVRAAMAVNMTPEVWRQVIDVNLTGAFYCLQAVGRHMCQRIEAGDKGPAAIVNVSSDAGRRGSIGQINYSAAKSGMLGLTMSAAREWSAKGVRTNSVCFGVVETEMTETIRSEKFRDKIMAQIPMGRFASAEEVVKAIAFLLSPAASYITGQHLSVSGGYTIAV